MNQPGFFQTRDSLDRSAERVRGTFQELVLIAGIAYSAGGHGANRIDVQLRIRIREPSEHGADVLDRFLTDRSGLEHTRTDTRDFAVSGKSHPRRVRDHL